MKFKVGDFVRVKKETHNYNTLIIQGQIGRIIDCDYYKINRVYGIEFDFIDIAHLHNCRGKGKENQCDYVFEQDLELITNEETEWRLKFGNITRTETLSLPNFDKFKKVGFPIFYCKNGNTITVAWNNTDFSLWENEEECIFDEPLTKENYEKACELAKKLFLGGEE